MPSSRHVRTMRRAISPRLAIRIFWNTYAGTADRAWVTVEAPRGGLRSRGPYRSRSPDGAVGVGGAPEDEAPLRLQPREGQAVHALDSRGHRLAAAEAGEQLGERGHAAALEEVPHEPERRPVAGARLGDVARREQRLDAREREAPGKLQELLVDDALEMLRETFLEPAGRPTASDLVDDRVRPLVSQHAGQGRGGEGERARRQADLAVEEAAHPVVRAGPAGWSPRRQAGRGRGAPAARPRGRPGPRGRPRRRGPSGGPRPPETPPGPAGRAAWPPRRDRRAGPATPSLRSTGQRYREGRRSRARGRPPR